MFGTGRRAAFCYGMISWHEALPGGEEWPKRPFWMRNTVYACCCVCAEEPQSLCDIGLSIGSNWLFGSIGEALSWCGKARFAVRERHFDGAEKPFRSCRWAFPVTRLPQNGLSVTVKPWNGGADEAVRYTFQRYPKSLSPFSFVKKKYQRTQWYLALKLPVAACFIQKQCQWVQW